MKCDKEGCGREMEYGRIVFLKAGARVFCIPDAIEVEERIHARRQRALAPEAAMTAGGAPAVAVAPRKPRGGTNPATGFQAGSFADRAGAAFLAAGKGDAGLEAIRGALRDYMAPETPAAIVDRKARHFLRHRIGDRPQYR